MVWGGGEGGERRGGIGRTTVHDLMWRISYLEMLTISPTGTFIAAAGSDKCIFIHEFASGEKVESLYGHSGKYIAFNYIQF